MHLLKVFALAEFAVSGYRNLSNWVLTCSEESPTTSFLTFTDLYILASMPEPALLGLEPPVGIMMQKVSQERQGRVGAYNMNVGHEPMSSRV